GRRMGGAFKHPLKPSPGALKGKGGSVMDRTIATVTAVSLGAPLLLVFAALALPPSPAATAMPVHDARVKNISAHAVSELHAHADTQRARHEPGHGDDRQHV